jgi:AcrR family transcriptional regulator
MGKLDEKKRQKRESLLESAFSLFTSKGINDTSISDIAREAHMAKGTFYLYFKDKYEIRDKLIAAKAKQLFHKASVEVYQENLSTLEEKVVFIADTVVNRLNEDKMLLKFISKNLSWGVFHNVLVTETDEGGENSFYDGYFALLAESGRKFRNPDLMLYLIIELIGSTCYNVILQQEPVTLEVLKPELYGTIVDIIHRQEIKEPYADNKEDFDIFLPDAAAAR